MSNVEFELISSDRLNKTCQTDFRLCFTCQFESFRIYLPKKVRLFIVVF